LSVYGTDGFESGLFGNVEDAFVGLRELHFAIYGRNENFGLGTAMVAQHPAAVRLTRLMLDESGIRVDEEVIGERRDFAIEVKPFAVVVIGG